MFYIASLLYLPDVKEKFLQGILLSIIRSFFLVNVEELYKTFAIPNLSELYILFLLAERKSLMIFHWLINFLIFAGVASAVFLIVMA